ncbi:MAG: hypothetical protein GF372_09395 [Candidatus Marinimicrobia bacterium]|nr:hypothetical protein [Candidatus Neomarinimicrobiota bacterium]
MRNLTRRQYGKYFFSDTAGTAFIGSAVDVKSVSVPPFPKNPKIVCVCSNQHSYKVTGFMGQLIVRSPNIDRIAAKGTVITDA